MRKIILPLVVAFGVVILIGSFLFANRERRYPEASFSLLNEAETAWYNAGILDYRVVVEVEFASEHRRHAITVRNGQITETTLSYLNGDTWSPPEPIAVESAAEYTIPGLFNALRLELNQLMREDLRVDMNETPVYPRYMYFGAVWVDGEPMADSEARFTVTEFEILTSP